MAAVAASCCKPSSFLGQFHSSSGKSQCTQISGTSVPVPRITALFWGSRKSTTPQEVGLSLGDFTLTGSTSKDISANEVKPKKISLSVVSSILEVSANDWDACTLDATSPEKYNPFLTHAFLSSLEESGCAVKVVTYYFVLYLYKLYGIYFF
ncbi:hypothetical protein CIPAW_06G176500 [Carya illinoinensis]|uniref:Uncharacterized protein n=1 Tax=Carya illinoinensis TaxID=32201 RepID=A0A8T1QDC8_CARIL|nr:hypothetical protein CIPAW_06G176500 [Carya illinoinensis]